MPLVWLGLYNDTPVVLAATHHEGGFAGAGFAVHEHQTLRRRLELLQRRADQLLPADKRRL